LLASLLATWLAVSPSGDRLSVAWDAPGETLEVDAATGRTIGKRAFEAGPWRLNRVEGSLTKLGDSPRTVAICREPFATAPTPDGRRLFVSCLLPEQAATASHVAARVVVVDTGTLSPLASILLPNGSTAARGIAISPDGRWAFVAHIVGRYTVPASQLEQGWINTNALTIIDARRMKVHATVLLDDPAHGAANPWAVAVGGDGRSVYVTHAGAAELSVIDLPALLARIAEGGEGGTGALGFLYGIRRRIPLPGKGPRALAVSGDAVWVAEYFTRTLTRVRPAAVPEIRSISAGTAPPDTLSRRGEMLFHGAGLSPQKWQSCSSCHPDARADGLNWDLLNDGIGSPKNTRSLVNAHRSGAAMWTGVRESASAAVRSGMRHILFIEPSEPDALAIESWLKSLIPIPGPARDKGAVERGRKLFFREDVGCSSCHPPPLYTDNEMRDVGTHGPSDVSAGSDRQRTFRTPSLLEAWRTAPYMHDGRYATLREVITKGNAGDRRGRTSSLSRAQIDDLVAFLLSL
jgi:mono/diheme cytochrome c family protein